MFETFSVRNPHSVNGDDAVRWGIVICCPDARYARVSGKNSPQMAGVVEADRSAYRVDYVTWPGASKAFIDPVTREHAIGQLVELARLHKSRWIVLVDHEDCGKWKDELELSMLSDKQFHYNRLREAYAVIRNMIKTDLPIVLAYASGRGEDVTFEYVAPEG